MALIDIQVPDIGDFKDVAVIEVLVKPGDSVKAEQSLITVESDKASMEIPSSHAGVVQAIKVNVGDKVNQGTVIVSLEVAGAAAAGAATGAAAGAAPSASSVRISEPSLTVSPSLTFSSLTTPACDDGISIEALSLSTVMSDCSALTASPGLTRSSMTATSLKSPMSGTLMSMSAIQASCRAAPREACAPAGGSERM